MSIKAENTLNEIAYAGGYFSDKPIQTTATGSAGAGAFSGNVSVAGTLSVTGVSTLGVTGPAAPINLGSGGPQLLSGTLAPPLNPTGVSAPLGSIFINLGATGVTNRAYINTNGATGWTYLGTSGA